MNKLAMFGGEKVRTESYKIHNTILDDAEEKVVIEVLRGGHLSGFSARPGERFLGGDKVKEFEQNLARYFNVEYAVTFNSATSALHGAMSAVGVGPGDEVITSPYTMSATAASIVMANGVPVFADVEGKTFGIDPEQVEKLITPYTKAILTVNIFGHPSRLNELKEIADSNGVVLVEDNAQSPGVKYKQGVAGTIGDMGILSLNYHKAIQTGEGGVVLTNNKQYADHLRLVRNHAEVVVGATDRQDIVNLLGWNYRLTELQAAIGIEQLKKLAFFTQSRQELANYLTEQLKKYDFIIPPTIDAQCEHGFYLYPFRYLEPKLGISRRLFVEAIQKEGVSISGGYVKPIYLEPMFQQKIAYGTQGCPFKCPHYQGNVNYAKGMCPTVERLHFEEMLITDICKYPNTKREVDELVAAITKVVENIDALKEVVSY